MSKSHQLEKAKRPGRKPENFTFDFQVEYVPVPKDRVDAYRAGLVLLLELLHEEQEAYEKEIQENNSNQ